jgi:S-adenosylmethionine synthetase
MDRIEKVNTCLAQYPSSRVACEALVTTDFITVAGGIGTGTKRLSIEHVLP